MIIAVDFDGTCVTHAYPEIGQDIGAAPVLRELVANGHKLILWTMRSKATLLDAVEWFKFNSIPLFGVNTNPEQREWTDSPKAYAQLYIDDAALGAPLLCPIVAADGHIIEAGRNRPFVDWTRTRELLAARELI